MGGLVELRAGGEVVTVRLAVFRIGVEDAIRIQALGATGRLARAGPLDAGATPQLRVGERAVVARPPAGALTPRVERGLGVVPFDERSAVAIPELHARGVVQEDAEIGSGLAGRIDRALRDVDRAIHVRERPRLLAPEGGG